MKYISILGDSISTYEGYNPEGYKVYYRDERLIINSMESVRDTWWDKVIRAFDARLCVNNSFSGSRVSGKEFPAATSDKRIAELRNNQCTPDVVLIFMGVNDYGFGVKINRSETDSPQDDELLYFAYAYEHLLEKIKQAYPEAIVVCGTLMRTVVTNNDRWSFPEEHLGEKFENFNIAIKKVCKNKGYYLADLAGTDLSYQTYDGAHPTNKGHITIARAWIKCLNELGIM